MRSKPFTFTRVKKVKKVTECLELNLTRREAEHAEYILKRAKVTISSLSEGEKETLDQLLKHIGSFTGDEIPDETRM